MARITGSNDALIELSIAALLVALCVVLHAAGLLVLSRWAQRHQARGRRGYGRELWAMVRMAWAILGLHLMEIMLWTLAYLHLGCMPDGATAFYFSSVTYTTVGYGDLVLAPEWRNLSGMEALTGMFLLGLSTAYFFAYLAQVFRHRFQH